MELFIKKCLEEHSLPLPVLLSKGSNDKIKLHLKGYGLGKSGLAKALGSIVIHLISLGLESLDVSDNAIGPETSLLIVNSNYAIGNANPALNHKSLTELDLSNNNIGCIVCETLAGNVIADRRLRRLGISQNKLSTKALLLFIGSLCPNKTLETLEMNSIVRSPVQEADPSP